MCEKLLKYTKIFENIRKSLKMYEKLLKSKIFKNVGKALKKIRKSLKIYGNRKKTRKAPKT